VREDLLGKQAKDTPFLLDWNLQATSPGTYFNTPATYPVYVTGLNVAYMLKNGGLAYYTELADRRAKLLYGFIDSSMGFYTNKVSKQFRSKINVPMRIMPDNQHEEKVSFRRLELKFLDEATS